MRHEPWPPLWPWKRHLRLRRNLGRQGGPRSAADGHRPASRRGDRRRYRASAPHGSISVMRWISHLVLEPPSILAFPFSPESPSPRWLHPRTALRGWGGCRCWVAKLRFDVFSPVALGDGASQLWFKSYQGGPDSPECRGLRRIAGPVRALDPVTCRLRAVTDFRIHRIEEALAAAPGSWDETLRLSDKSQELLLHLSVMKLLNALFSFSSFLGFSMRRTWYWIAQRSPRSSIKST